MKYPSLVPPWVCSVPIKLIIESEELSEDGGPVESYTVETKCNFQNGGETYFGKDAKVVYTDAKAYFTGDILPDVPNIVNGEAIIFGQRREIKKGYKRRNPDGTVNFTEVVFK